MPSAESIVFGKTGSQRPLQRRNRHNRACGEALNRQQLFGLFGWERGSFPRNVVQSFPGVIDSLNTLLLKSLPTHRICGRDKTLSPLRRFVLVVQAR